MIIHSFDDRSDAVVSPEAFLGKKRDLCPVAIATFSREIYERVLSAWPGETVGELSAANRVKPLRLMRAGKLEFVFYLSELGSALAATDIIEAHWMTGANRFIVFGSCGSLDRALTQGKYILPTEAYRDEGMSYHYAPPADYIPIPTAAFLRDFFEREGLPFLSGRVWTTDAFYRETRSQVARRKAEGCVAVEMELAGLQAVCDFYGIQLYDFLVAGDTVDQPDYTPDGLSEANHSMDKFDIALRLARELARQA